MVVEPVIRANSKMIKKRAITNQTSEYEKYITRRALAIQVWTLQPALCINLGKRNIEIMNHLSKHRSVACRVNCKKIILYGCTWVFLVVSQSRGACSFVPRQYAKHKHLSKTSIQRRLMQYPQLPVGKLPAQRILHPLPTVNSISFFSFMAFKPIKYYYPQMLK